MCIVIDTNSLSCVFDQHNSQHCDFKPVLKWIRDGKGKIVYGGTSYEKELKTARRFVKIFLEFHKVNKVVVIEKATVDNKEKECKTLVNHRDFNDHHIISIIIVSGVKLVCTNDKRAIQFLTNTQFYARGKRPKVYTSKKNANLLCDRNIAECCKPSLKLNKNTCEHLDLIK